MENLKFKLPVGYTDEAGTLHCDGLLAVPCGRDEEVLNHVNGNGPDMLHQLLARCVKRLGTVRSVSTDMVQRLHQADLDTLLLKLWEINYGHQVRSTVPCPRPGCHQKTDIDFSVRDIPVDTSGQPQLFLEMEAYCYNCDDNFDAPFDIYRSFFNRMQAGLQQLFREVHCLAWHYHWSENEIMGMSRTKRHTYLEILADEIERINQNNEEGYNPHSGRLYHSGPLNHVSFTADRIEFPGTECHGVEANGHSIRRNDSQETGDYETENHGAGYQATGIQRTGSEETGSHETGIHRAAPRETGGTGPGLPGRESQALTDGSLDTGLEITSIQLPGKSTTPVQEMPVSMNDDSPESEAQSSQSPVGAGSTAQSARIDHSVDIPVNSAGDAGSMNQIKKSLQRDGKSLNRTVLNTDTNSFSVKESEADLSISSNTELSDDSSADLSADLGVHSSTDSSSDSSADSGVHSSTDSSDDLSAGTVSNASFTANDTNGPAGTIHKTDSRFRHKERLAKSPDPKTAKDFRRDGKAVVDNDTKGRMNSNLTGRPASEQLTVQYNVFVNGEENDPVRRIRRLGILLNQAKAVQAASDKTSEQAADTDIGSSGSDKHKRRNTPFKTDKSKTDRTKTGKNLSKVSQTRDNDTEAAPPCAFWERLNLKRFGFNMLR